MRSLRETTGKTPRRRSGPHRIAHLNCRQTETHKPGPPTNPSTSRVAAPRGDDQKTTTRYRDRNTKIWARWACEKLAALGFVLVGDVELTMSNFADRSPNGRSHQR